MSSQPPATSPQPPALKSDIFKAYDIRGVYPDQLDEDVAHRVGRAFVALLDARKVVVARDMRYKSSSEETLVFKFSKTAEESSDWVFMAMQDSAGNAKYDTPEAQVNAFSCLDSRK